MTQSPTESPGTGSLVGQIIAGRYRVIEPLGEGGMGAVYIAEQIALQKRVALKVIHADIAGDGEIRARFEREAMASSKIDGHPHVASATDFGELPDGSLFLVMQLAKGSSLQRRIDQGPIAWPRVAAIGAQIADALSAAHGAGIVHRDLKPDNVMLVPRDDGSEIVKVLDFGIARVANDAASTGNTIAGLQNRALTRVGTIMGTPGYMSPEQAIGEVVDHRTDLYALGVILWEMLVGRPLFDGTDFQTIVARQFGETVTAPSRASDPSIPEALDQVVLSLLARRAADRPEKASMVRDALQELAVRASLSGELPVAATNPGVRIAGRDFGDDGTGKTWIARGANATSPGSTGGLASRLPAPLSTLLATRRGRILAAVVPALGLIVVLVAFVGLGGSEGVPTTPAELVARVTESRPAEPELAPELAAALEVLSSSDDRRARDAAATTLAGAPADAPIPPYGRELVALEQARSCRARKDVLVRLRTLGDRRALPYVTRLHASPRRGCGLFGTRDCNACMRDELEATFVALGGTPTATAPATGDAP
ncbi:MAG: serine/threonine-protein kinase [Polyangiales bacterium]